jgi:hypothetical protein
MFYNLLKPMSLGYFCHRLPLQVVGCHIIENCVIVLSPPLPALFSWGFEFLQVYTKQAELIADCVGICENGTHIHSFYSQL